jgi:hypothetical protein
MDGSRARPTHDYLAALSDCFLTHAIAVLDAVDQRQRASREDFVFVLAVAAQRHLRFDPLERTFARRGFVAGRTLTATEEPGAHGWRVVVAARGVLLLVFLGAFSSFFLAFLLLFFLLMLLRVFRGMCGGVAVRLFAFLDFAWAIPFGFVLLAQSFDRMFFGLRRCSGGLWWFARSTACKECCEQGKADDCSSHNLEFNQIWET